MKLSTAEDFNKAQEVVDAYALRLRGCHDVETVYGGETSLSAVKARLSTSFFWIGTFRACRATMCCWHSSNATTTAESSW